MLEFEERRPQVECHGRMIHKTSLQRSHFHRDLVPKDDFVIEDHR